MIRFLKVIGVLLLLAAACILLMVVLGSRLQKAHTASASVDIAAPQAKVWQLMEDIQAQPSWRSELKAVEPYPDQNGHRCWMEVQQQMRMPLCEDAASAPSTRIVRIADPDLPFGGVWIYQLTSTGPNSSRLLITENGTTGPALWRFLGHYVFHEDTMIKEYESEIRAAATK